MAKYLFSVRTNYVGSKVEEVVEIPDSEFEWCETDDDKAMIVDKWFQDWLQSNADMGWLEVEGEK